MPKPLRMLEPWFAVVSALSRRAPAPIMHWPVAQRRVVRCVDNSEVSDVGEWSARSQAMQLRGRPEPRAASDARLLEALRRAPVTLADLSVALRCSRHSLSSRLTRLRREGRVRRIGTGLWALT